MSGDCRNHNETFCLNVTVSEQRPETFDVVRVCADCWEPTGLGQPIDSGIEVPAVKLASLADKTTRPTREEIAS